MDMLTPEQALRRAFWTIKLPSTVLMFGSWFIALGFLNTPEYRPELEARAITWSVILFIGGLAAGWLVWSVQIPKWKCWAYARVSDIEELKQIAVARQYLWPDGHIFGKTEIASEAVRQEIERLEKARRR